MNREFLLELVALLEKHNANIGFRCSDCSDTHGINDERIEATFGDNTSIILAAGWAVDSKDIFEALSMNEAQWKTHCKHLTE